MDLQLKGKRALVTGSSSGIGAAIAKTLAKEGATVAIQGRNHQKVNQVVQDIVEQGGYALAATGDLTQNEDAQKVIDTVLETLGGIDILVNNAGAYPLQSWTNATVEDWIENFETNVFSMVRVLNLLLPHMKTLEWGRIIQISSNAGVQAFPGAPHYSATKAANINMSVSLAKELSGTGVTANTVSPGPIVTEGWIDFAQDIAQEQGWGTDLEVVKRKFLEMMGGLPSGRLGEPEDVANLVAFVASPLAGYINGANLRVDGGQTPTVN
ncbi:MAG: 3-oxoacyl-[acyl-carrier-protein] reductase FabG [Chroococcidiopsis cubana SAG 39.79]|uniref:3-oxoacyl-ACP reductase n=1 Tax=Chroococcidiopsis cubana SAG 39.79 TaxID=388085 RepID=A0AB37UCJ1_9CYAN|nr:SDR family NAD(P)-dependent oxidoreductase [Chroococcidiopsis cubana]MDZ4872172.1 3-oxoacyl-[acyl-carrier-protein] reductase FabG [Chroococcidiopsis cubana SAG 39.79]PSB64395.1 short-chain dehydrogenase [Chroococcidiopsis cubana CCALA 043]RUT04158.1 3-oxoacyl-ACP reductase [Chroococcidiopsis cubana SAG 39.79]